MFDEKGKDSESAGVISFEELSKEIGSVKEDPKKDVEEALSKALEGKEEDEDYLGLEKRSREAEEAEEAEKEAEGTKEEEEDKEGTTELPIDDSKEDPKVESETSSFFKDAIKSIWGDEIEKIVQDVDGEEVEVSFEDLDMDVETFKDIVNSKIAEIKEESAKGKISEEGISEFTKRLIDVEKNGGDVRSLLELKQSYSDPLDGIDSDTVEGQRELVYLRLKAAGQPDADINRLIKSYESEGILEEVSGKAETELRTAIEAKFKAEEDRAAKLVEKRKEDLKAYRKDLKESLSKSFELKDSIKNKIVDIATKENKGSFELDNVYAQVRQDPEKAAELALFLLDREEFIKQVTKKEVLESKLTTAKKLKVIPRTGGSVTVSKDKKDSGIISFDDLK